MKVIAVNDTNIIIDLFNIGLLDLFFSSDIELHTTDFVLNELTDKEQLKVIRSYISVQKLKVKSFSGEELAKLFEFAYSQSSNVSPTDCSVWQYAQENSYTLLTGDGNLRRDAQKSGVTVRGVLFVFDYLTDCGLLSYNLAIAKLKELLSGNIRLPKTACTERLDKWSKML